MADIIREFFVKIGGAIDPSLAQAGAQVEKTGEAIKASAARAGEGVDGLATRIKQLGAVLAGGFAASRFFASIRATVDSFNALGDAAARIGNVTAETLDKVGYVATLTGSNAQAAQMSVENFSRVIGEAAAGAGRGEAVFKLYGLSARDAAGNIKSVEVMLSEVGEKLKKLSAAEQQAMLARLGMSRTMVGTLTGDNEELTAGYEDRIKALGLDVNHLAAISGDFNNALFISRRALKDIWASVVLRILPTITDAFERFSAWIDKNAEKIAGVVKTFSAAFDVILIAARQLAKPIAAVVALLASMPGWVHAVAVGSLALFKLWKLSPFGKMAAAVSAVVAAVELLIDDFETFREGGESLIDWAPILKGVDLVVDGFRYLMNLPGKFFAVFTEVIEKLGAAIRGFFSGFVRHAKAVFADLAAKARGFISGLIEAALSAFADLAARARAIFAGVFGKIGEFVSDLFGSKDAKISVTGGSQRSAGLATAARPLAMPAQAAIPAGNVSTVNNTQNTDNRSRTINQTFNVRSREEASAIAFGSFRQLGGVEEGF